MQYQSELLKDISSLFDKYDKKANNLKKVFEWIWRTGIFAGVIAVIIFAYLTIYRKDFDEIFKGLVLPVIEVVLIVFSFIALSKLAPRQKKRFIDARRSAEILRIHELFALNKLPLKSSNMFSLKDYKTPEDILAIEQKAKQNVNFQSSHTDQKKVLENFREFMDFGEDGQKKYHFEERIKKFHKREHQLELALQIILWFFVALIGLKLCVELLMYFNNDQLFGVELKYFLKGFKFSVIFLPPLYAALEGFHYFSEWKRNITFSERVNAEYEVLLSKIENLKKQQSITSSEVNNIANELFDIFHKDNQNWYRWYMSKKIGARI